MNNFLTSNNLEFYLFGITKIFFVLFALLYFVFAIIVVKQVTSMSKSVSDKFNYILIIFSFLHLAFSVLLILIMLGL
ncbi:MAG: hypothetical protein PHP97_04250 [Candidatus Shapirobacteria bacterium]|nr:hypothetical protein [Candidatus Shapirobacteria bacterium]MDD4383423.1 hypothetical protein [Candidatus Shapirobacteria bacterium]